MQQIPQTTASNLQDKNKGDPAATEKFKEVSEAYDVSSQRLFPSCLITIEAVQFFSTLAL